MKICSIEAKNFRTLADFSLDFKRNYCAISGKNNAGKSAVIRIIEFFLRDRNEDRLLFGNGITFAKDATQWVAGDDIEVSISVEIDRDDDSEVFFVVDTYNTRKLIDKHVGVKLTSIFSKDGGEKTVCLVDGNALGQQESSEILKKFRSTSNLIVHNSTQPSRQLYYLGGTYKEVLDAYFSPEDRQKIAEAEKGLQTRVKKATKQQKEELEKLLGKLNEKYQVELSSIDSGRSSRFPLEVKLTDKNVEVPLNDWGAGTQNRTRVLMSVLDAIRIRSSVNPKDRSTPVFIVEEPESFLHPSAQAEFGQVLNGLAEELEIQIIATTHSPYMLNQNDPSANILLERKVFRNSLRDTTIIDTSGKDWMLPFAENLGIIPSEFESWKGIFSSNSSKAVLVEGDIDRVYFETIKGKFPKLYKIPDGVEIVPYGGKDALKNTSLLQFMINRFGRVFITFDLDARHEIKPSLERIGLVEGRDFIAVGKPAAGCQCIEGLLPANIMKQVYSNEYMHVMALQSQETKERNSAKSHIKKCLLEEFKSTSVLEKDMIDFQDLFNKISKAFL
ncbi:MAG: AAA family ATPase [Bosea sp.]|uniref:ATP-dependent nuclease n=1 Tax=unclassified Bosea (in: a-proteobacteria) TaxID=2653178 RepID=UPI001AC0AE9C|nr:MULTISPECIES: AAA family ATPase [unclassified Bosea (in: a-proteobacteria)]MBN9455002.1 AAA family ATPase [Bosea sp. (in: a-proteobacteria)]